jgi:hypothetical protein
VSTAALTPQMLSFTIRTADATFWLISASDAA